MGPGVPAGVDVCMAAGDGIWVEVAAVAARVGIAIEVATVPVGVGVAMGVDASVPVGKGAEVGVAAGALELQAIRSRHNAATRLQRTCLHTANITSCDAFCPRGKRAWLC